MKLKIKQTTETEITLDLPAFFKHQSLNFYYAIFAENDACCVQHQIAGDMVVSHNYPISCILDGKQEISTKEVFVSALKTAIETINKQYQEVMDDIEMLTENDNTEDPAHDELKYQEVRS